MFTEDEEERRQLDKELLDVNRIEVKLREIVTGFRNNKVGQKRGV